MGLMTTFSYFCALHMPDGVPGASTRCAEVERIKSRHILLRKFKVVNLGVGGDTRGSVGLGERAAHARWSDVGEVKGQSAEDLHVTLLQRPADQDLSARLAKLLGDFDEDRVVESLTANDGAVGLNDDAICLAVLDDGLLLAPGV